MENINYKYIYKMKKIKDWYEKYKDLNIEINNITSKRHLYNTHESFPDLTFSINAFNIINANIFPFNCGITVLNNLNYSIEIKYYEAILDFLQNVCDFSMVMLSIRKSYLDDYKHILSKFEFKQLEECSFHNSRSGNDVVLFYKKL